MRVPSSENRTRLASDSVSERAIPIPERSSYGEEEEDAKGEQKDNAFSNGRVKRSFKVFLLVLGVGGDLSFSRCVSNLRTHPERTFLSSP